MYSLQWKISKYGIKVPRLIFTRQHVCFVLIELSRNQFIWISDFIIYTIYTNNFMDLMLQKLCEQVAQNLYFKSNFSKILSPNPYQYYLVYEASLKCVFSVLLTITIHPVCRHTMYWSKNILKVGFGGGGVKSGKIYWQTNFARKWGPNVLSEHPSVGLSVVIYFLDLKCFVWIIRHASYNIIVN